MKTTDTCFSDAEKSLLAGMVGETFEKYRIDKFVSGTCESSFGIVGLFVGGKTYALIGELEARDWFGGREDIAVTSVKRVEPGELKSRLVGKPQVDWEVNDTIEDIEVYEDARTAVCDGEDFFECRFTSAVVFKTARTQVVIEPAGWIMEEFDVWRGPGADKRISPVEKEILDGGDIVLSINGKPYTGPLDSVATGEEPDSYRVERRVVSLSEWAEGR